MRREGWARCVVAATGPSLSQAVADRVRELQLFEFVKIIAVNDAWRLLPFADVLWVTDRGWWDVHGDIKFAGERWTSQGANLSIDDDKRKWGRVDELRLRLVTGRDGETFSTAPGEINYGNNAGFAAVNLAIQFGATDIRLVGFDMRRTDGKEHFFGDHPAPLHNGSNFASFCQSFEKASRAMPAGVSVTNCTPGSALRCFPMGSL